MQYNYIIMTDLGRTRNFRYQSGFTDGSLALALAPALTPEGLDYSPNFFRGFAVYPQVFARGLLVLADITAARYFKYTPVSPSTKPYTKNATTVLSVALTSPRRGTRKPLKSSPIRRLGAR
jgi:hypothetical protein